MFTGELGSNQAQLGNLELGQVEVFVDTGIVTGDHDWFLSDGAQGVDVCTLTGSETLNQSTTDTGSGSEVATINLSQSESGSGSDTPSLVIPAADSGSASEALTLTASETLTRSATDTGTATESATLPTADHSVSDSAMGTDVAAAPAFVVESGSGSETAGPIVVSASETGAGSEALTLTASETLDQSATDTGSGSEAFSIAATSSASDTGVGSDSASAPGDAADAGSGTDQGSTTAAISASDTGSGADSPLLVYADQIASDTGSAAEAGSTTASISAAESGSGAEVGTPAPSGADQGLFSETGTLTASISATDSGSATEAVDFPYKDFNISDAGSGAESATLPYADQIVSETASGADAPTVGQLAADTGSGADAVPAFSLQGNESPVGSDAGTVCVSCADSGSGADAAAMQVDATDAGSATEAASVSITITAFDSGHAQDLLCLELSGSIGPRVPRIGPEVYLPSWVRAHTDTTLAPASGNLLFNLFQHWAEGFVPFRGQLHRGRENRWLISARVKEPRFEWSAPNKSSDLPKSILFTAPVLTRVISGVVRQATSLFDFDLSVDPVWWLDPISRQLRFRNLHVKQATKTSSNGLYSLCGESDGAVPDSGVYWRRHPDQSWEWIDPESPQYQSDNGPSFTVPFTGTILIAWGSQSLLTGLLSGSVRIAGPGGQSVDLPLAWIDRPNLFDGYGDLLALPRLPREDNLSYKRRLLTETEIPYDESEPGASRAIAARLGLIASLRWDGVSTLPIDPGDVSGITAIRIASVDRIRSVQESLLPIDAGLRTYHATYPNWRHGWLLFVDGIPEPAVSLSGNVVTLSRSTSGAVLAQYAVDQYRIQYSSSGTIRALLPGTGLSSGGYQVLLARGVAVHSTDRLEFRRDRLLDARGLPNGLFLDLSSALLRDNPTLFARARWDHASWLNQSDRTPASVHLQVPMDLDSIPLSGSL